MNFKKFLLEVTDYEESYSSLVYKQLTLDETIKHLRTDFSDCAWMVHQNCVFYRGDTADVTDSYAWVDSSKGKRRSQNTSNYYTLIFDNNPQRKSFPKRSSSLICSTSEKVARDYSIHPLRIIPGNSAKIGFVNESDMWGTVISLFGESNEIEAFNSIWNRFPSLSDSSWKTWEALDKRLKRGDENSMKEFYRIFPNAEPDDHLEFLESIFRAYGKRTGHTAFEASNLTCSMLAKNTEVWIGGPCLVVHEHSWKELRDKFGEIV